MGDTSIQWTDKSWSPLRARVKADAAAIATAKGYTSLIRIATKMAGHAGPHCERVSHGCDHCYSDTNNGRCLPSNGTGLPFDRRSRDLVNTFVDEKILVQPLKWREPKKVFVMNQSDLFGEWVTDEQIDRVFAVMALCPKHTFQCLTKRPERMLAYFADIPYRQEMFGIYAEAISGTDRFRLSSDEETGTGDDILPRWTLPLPNVWLGVSVEDQATADARIPLLLQTPATVRFISYEPALGPVDFTPFLLEQIACDDAARNGFHRPPLDWLIIGGESGPGARLFDIAWVRNTIQQCKAAGVACFVKQMGAWVTSSHQADWPGKPGEIQATGNGLESRWRMRLDNRKGGTMAEWPEDLRVREFPAVSR